MGPGGGWSVALYSKLEGWFEIKYIFTKIHHLTCMSKFYFDVIYFVLHIIYQTLKAVFDHFQTPPGLKIRH